MEKYYKMMLIQDIKFQKKNTIKEKVNNNMIILKFIDTLRNFLKENKLKNYHENDQSKETIVKRFCVNQKCVVKSPGKPDRNGYIRYIGYLNFNLNNF